MRLNALLERNVVVLTASRRLAHALRADYARHAQSQGRAVWRTPQTPPWIAWLREQYGAARAAEGGATGLLTPAQSGVLWRRIVADSAAGENLLNPSEAARLAERSWRRLHDYLIPLAALDGAAELEARVLREWCLAYARRCRELNVRDEAQLAAWATSAKLIPEQPVALAGFDAVPPALAQLVELWRAADKFIEAAPDAPEASDVRVFGAPDAAAELEAAARWARALYEQHGAAIGVLVPGLQGRRQEARRVFEDVFFPGARMGQAASASPVVVAAAGSLSEYPLIDAALGVLRLAERSDSVMLGRLLRSPFITGGESERDARALADLRLREQQREHWSWFELEHWAEAAAPRLRLAAQAVASVLRNEPSPAAPSRWAERFHSILQAAGWPGERPLNSPERQTLQKFQAALAEFGGLDLVLSPLTLRQALAHLQDVLRDTPFEPESPGAAVTIIDPATAAGMSFDAVWLTGLDAERWPAPADPDPFIPLRLQREAGAPEASAEGMRRLASARLARWLRSAASLALSWPRREADAELEPSPLLSRWPIREALEGAGARPWRRTLFEHRPPLDRLADENAPALAPSAARGGARILELQSQCPFRAQAELRLHADAVPAVPVGLDSRQRGKILHRVLEQLWRRMQEHATLASAEAASLEAQVRTLAEHATAHALRVTTGHRARLAKLEVDHVTRQVMQLLALERARPPFRVRFAETAETQQIGGLMITLRPDRIDELASHATLLIDYKLGDAHVPRHWLDERPDRPRSPQLPLYALAHEHALEGLAFVTLAPGAVEYRGWSKSGAAGAGVALYPPRTSKRLDAPPDWAALLAHWRRTLTRLAQRYAAGEAAVDPLPQACERCRLSALCRIHERSQPSTGEEGGENE